MKIILRILIIAWTLAVCVVYSVRADTYEIQPGDNYPVNTQNAFTLAASGLYTGDQNTGFKAGTSTTADLIMVFNQTLGGGAGGWDMYFYSTPGGLVGGATGGWRQVGKGRFDASGVTIPAATAVLIRRKNPPAFIWTIP